MHANKISYFCFLLYALMLCSVHAGAIEVTLATGINEDPPYVYGNKEVATEYPGVTIDIFKLIEKKTNIKFNIVKQPWARVVRNVKTNQIDGGFHFSFKKERTSFVAYPILEGSVLPDSKYSVSNRSYALYKLKGKSVRWNGKQIVSESNLPMAIAAIRGGSITGDIKRLGHELFEANSDKQLLELLLINRVDAIVALDNMIDAKIKTLAAEQRSMIEKTFPVVGNKPYYVAFSKQFYRENKQTVWDIWEAINLIKNNGELDNIFDRYARNKSN